MSEFEREFEDLCEQLNGKLVKKPYLAEMACVLKGAVLYGYSSEDSLYGESTIVLKKRGIATLVVEGFERAVSARQCLETGFLKTKSGLVAPVRKFGEHIGCFEADVYGAKAKVCLNEKGDIVYASLLTK